MSVETKRSPAGNRRAYHQGKVDAAGTGRERLNAYCGWLMAECRRLPAADLDDVIDRVAGIAQELNERSVL